MKSVQQSFQSLSKSGTASVVSRVSRRHPIVQSSQFRTISNQKIPTSKSFDAHHQAVARISAAVKDFHRRGERFRITHGSTNSTRRSKKSKNFVDTSELSNVVHIDTEARIAIVEPNVPMDRLVEATLEHGLVPPVVMDFPGIIVGGGYAGTSGESSSFKHGFFDRTLKSVEMVLADGEVLKASSVENSDLFHGAAGAVGTMGVTTLAELNLVKAKKYVRTTYHPVHSVEEAIRMIEKSINDPMLDFVDGIVFSKDKAAVITGYMTDRSTSRIKNFSDPWDPWFYLHVQDTVSRSQYAVTESIPLAEYLFRYDRGGFWVGKSAFEYFRFPFNKYTRWWLDDFLHTRMLYTALHASPNARPYFVQDLALPFSTASSFISHIDETLSIYPLWLCPLRQSPLPTMHPHHVSSPSSPLLNIGVWGWGPHDPRAFVAANRELEKKVRELGGMKWLYAQTYYGEEEFWSMFDREWYEGLREKYRAKGLPSVWDKVHVDEESEIRARGGWRGWVKGLWPLPGIYGIWKAIRSGTYMEARRAKWKGG
ncbi:MAG: hypothetical protein Q9165_006746 [Trypethelium subeluteriae]